MSSRPSKQQHGFQERSEWGGSGPLRKFIPTQVKQEGAASERKLKFIISTAGLDRDGDTISPDGWQLDNFRANPVVLFAHDYRNLPVARALETRVENGALVSVAKFASAEEYPFADRVYRMYKGRYMRAVSVGFKPVEWAKSDDPARPYGLDFLKQELLEYSCVPVPSNPNALAAGAGGRRGRGPAVRSGGRPGGIGISEEERALRDFDQRRQKKRDDYRREAGLVTVDPASVRTPGERSAGEIPDVSPEQVRGWFDQWFSEATGTSPDARRSVNASRRRT